jgi:hypothetical protein
MAPVAETCCMYKLYNIELNECVVIDRYTVPSSTYERVSSHIIFHLNERIFTTALFEGLRSFIGVYNHDWRKPKLAPLLWYSYTKNSHGQLLLRSIVIPLLGYG